MGPLARCKYHMKEIPDLVLGGTKRSGRYATCTDQRESKYTQDCGPSGKFWMLK